MNRELDDVARKPGAQELIQALQDITAKIERRPRLVAAIADPATTHEAFYSILFGEVDDLLHQVKTFEIALANAGKNVSDNMEEKTAKLENASRQIMAHLQELMIQSGALTTAKMKEAREKEEAELRRTAGAAIEAAIDAAVGKGVSRLNDALKILEISAARSEQKVARAAEAARPAWSALLLGVTVLSALLGGIGGFLVSRFL